MKIKALLSMLFCLQNMLMAFLLFQVCACAPGFELESNGQICRDVNECQQPSGQPCSQTCINTEGSYICACHPGYLLGSDGHTCKATGNLELGLSSKSWIMSFESLTLLLWVNPTYQTFLSYPSAPIFHSQPP